MINELELALAHLDRAKTILEGIVEDLEKEQNKKTIKIEIKSHFDEKVDEDDLNLDSNIEKFRKDLEEMLNDFTEKREG